MEPNGKDATDNPCGDPWCHGCPTCISVLAMEDLGEQPPERSVHWRITQLSKQLEQVKADFRRFAGPHYFVDATALCCCGSPWHFYGCHWMAELTVEPEKLAEMVQLEQDATAGRITETAAHLKAAIHLMPASAAAAQ